MSEIVETAERLSRRRTRMMPVLAFFPIIQQVAFFSHPARMRLVDMVSTGGWIVLALVIVAALATGGFWFRPKAVRELMDDEGTRANRANALATGFVFAMVTAIVLYGLAAFMPDDTTVREAVHAIVTIGLIAALVRFTVLERRALG